MTDHLNMHTPVRTDVPIRMHPDSLSGLGKALNRPDTLGANVYSAAREALKICYDSYGLLNDAQTAIRAAVPLNASQRKRAPQDGQEVRLVEGAQTLVVADDELVAAAKQAWSRIGPAIDRRLRELEGLHEVLEKRITSAVDEPKRMTPEGLALAQEVRSHVKSLSGKARKTLVVEAIESNDKATVAAVLHAQPFLSGLDNAALGILRERAAEKFAPMDSAQLAATTAAIEQVSNAVSLLLERYTKLLSSRNVPRRRDGTEAAEYGKKLAGGFDTTRRKDLGEQLASPLMVDPIWDQALSFGRRGASGTQQKMP